MTRTSEKPYEWLMSAAAAGIRPYDCEPRPTFGAGFHLRNGQSSSTNGRMPTAAVTSSQTGLEGRSKSRMKGGLGAGPHTVSTSTSMRNSSLRFVQRSKHVDWQRRNPSCNLPRCRSCDTRHARGLTNLKLVTNWPGGNFESGGFKWAPRSHCPGA